MSSVRWAAPDSGISIESVIAFACLQVAVVALALVDLVIPLGSQFFGTVCLAILAGIAFLTWRQTAQGNHPHISVHGVPRLVSVWTDVLVACFRGMDHFIV